MAYQSKAELLEEAQSRGLDVTEDNTREDIIAALDEADNAALDADETPVVAPETPPEAAAGENLGFPAQPGMAPPAE